METLRKLCEWLILHLPLPNGDGLYFRLHCQLAAWAMFGFGKIDSMATDGELPF